MQRNDAAILQAALGAKGDNAAHNETLGGTGVKGGPTPDLRAGGPGTGSAAAAFSASAIAESPVMDLRRPGLPTILVPPELIAVPEPASWALMLVGFGGVGGVLRRRRQLAAA